MKFILLLLLILPMKLFACGSDIDCSLGSKCVLKTEFEGGICTGPNSQDRTEAPDFIPDDVFVPDAPTYHYQTPAPSRPVGSVCQTHFDCEGFNFCIQGVCQ